MAEYIGKVTLRNTRDVFKDHKIYIVKCKSKREEIKSISIRKELVDYVFSKFSGKELIVEDIEYFLEREDVFKKFKIPFEYGFKLHFYAQDILIILVALNKATLKKRGNRYFYQTIKL